jgi:hypothetical protein
MTRNALYEVAAKRNKIVVQVLLNYKTKVNTQGGLYNNILQAAALNSHQDII